MKHSKKILALVLSVAVVASIAAAGTLAWLTDAAGIKNDFNVGTQGKVDIILDEEDNENPGTRTEEGNVYTDFLPGTALAKDPTVHVEANSAASYVFVSVMNGLGENGKLNINEDAWTYVKSIPEGQDIYMYTGEQIRAGVVPATGNDRLDLEPVFTTVTINPDLDAEGLADLDASSIYVLAYAIQADNIGAEGQTAADFALGEATTFFSGYTPSVI